MSPAATTLTPRPAVSRRGEKFAQAAAIALEPLQAELLRRARADTAERLQQAASDDAATIAAAEREAAQVVEQARQEGIREASVWLATQRARIRHQARGIILRARAEALRDLRQQSTAAVVKLSMAPDYQQVHGRLVDHVRRQLGEHVAISDTPSGGVIGTVPGRQLDCSFGTLLDQVLAEYASQPEMPWMT
jgi:vacuolar-type H+-ATPase subunit E/Vma4